jgi:hypothetical protein
VKSKKSSDQISGCWRGGIPGRVREGRGGGKARRQELYIREEVEGRRKTDARREEGKGEGQGRGKRKEERGKKKEERGKR